MNQQVTDAVIIKNINLFKDIAIHSFTIAEQGLPGAFNNFVLRQ
jgi:hypothetical protein